LIIAGRATPSLLVSYELSLAEAPDAYDKFDKWADGYTRVLLHPCNQAERPGSGLVLVVGSAALIPFDICGIGVRP
jgi:hypothetical protein